MRALETKVGGFHKTKAAAAPKLRTSVRTGSHRYLYKAKRHFQAPAAEAGAGLS
jgi:hypothetical protein